jgi:hypothetical protein
MRSGDIDGLRAAGARRGKVRAGLAHVVADLSIPDALRLDERRRALVLGILRNLLGTIEDRIREAAVDECAAAGPSLRTAAIALSQSRGSALWPVVETDLGALHADLVEAALQRSFEHLFSVRRSPGHVRLALLVARQPDSALAQRATDVAVADARRFDRFGDPVLLIDDLPAPAVESTAWLAGAALRHEVHAAGLEAGAPFEPALVAAIRSALATREEALGVRVRATRLATRLTELGENDDELLVALAEEGEIELLAACIARRAGLAASMVWRLLVGSPQSDFTILLRALGLSEPSATRLLELLVPPGATATPTAYAQIDQAAAQARLAAWRLPTAFSEAIESLGHGVG